MKRKNVWFLLVLGLVLASCASMETRYKNTMKYPTQPSLEKFIKDYPGTVYADKARAKLKELREADEFRKAEAANSTAAYERFLQSYPDGMFAGEARKRIALPDAEAFLATCGLGTAKAFQGYAESRPQSRYAALAASRAEYLTAVARGTVDSHRQFLAKFPNNPFVYEARAAFPVLLLEDTKVDAGVLIEVGDTVKWRGLFGGSVTKDEFRRKSFEELKKDLEKIGLRPVLLSKPDDPLRKNAKLIFSVVYKEYKSNYTPPPSSPGYNPRGQGGYVVQQMNQASANNLASVIGDIFVPTIKHVNEITIADPETTEVYYAGVRNMNEKIVKADLMKALARYKKQAAPSAMVGIVDKDGAVREAAAKLLAKAGDPAAAELLRHFVNDKAPAVRAAVAEALKTCGDGK